MRLLNSFSTSVSLARTFAVVLAFVSLSCPLEAGSRSLYNSEASRSAADKFRQIQEGAASGQPLGSVRISEAELNAYLDETQPDLPQGISAIHLKLQPSHPTGTAEIDFDRLKGSMKTQPNPLIAIFLRGEHTLGVEGTFTSSNGEGQFHLDTVTLDGITIPQMIVDYLIDSYLKAHYPDVPINRAFPLSYGIDQLTVEAGSVLVTGRQMAASARTRKPEKAIGTPLIPVRSAASGRNQVGSR